MASSRFSTDRSFDVKALAFIETKIARIVSKAHGGAAGLTLVPSRTIASPMYSVPQLLFVQVHLYLFLSSHSNFSWRLHFQQMSAFSVGKIRPQNRISQWHKTMAKGSINCLILVLPSVGLSRAGPWLGLSLP